MSFTFTRSPSVKVAIDIEPSGFVAADNTLVLVGRMAATGSSATANKPYTVQNYGDPVAAATECTTQFGSGAEIGDMVVAAIKAVQLSDLSPVSYPPIVCIPMANADTNLAAALSANITQQMPFVASAFPASDATNRTSLLNHLTAISADDRGGNGQYGSFGFLATDEDLSPASTEGTTAASQLICIAWLRDLAVSKSNKTWQVAAAVAALCASNGYPFFPMTDLVVGGLALPSLSADYHSTGDTGTEALGLAAGLIPLMSGSDGKVRISRTVTSYRPVSSSAATDYYDVQDWQKLYYIRKQFYTLAQLDRYKRAHATDAKLLALKSEMVNDLKILERDEVVQHVDELVKDLVVTRPSDNRYAGVYTIPLNIVPGFYNKGIELDGVTTGDTFQL